MSADCRKATFSSKAAAKRKLRRLQGHPDNNVADIYRCPSCNGWHLTSARDGGRGPSPPPVFAPAGGRSVLGDRYAKFRATGLRPGDAARMVAAEVGLEVPTVVAALVRDERRLAAELRGLIRGTGVDR